MPAMGRQLGRRPGRTPGQNVGASQRRHKALPAMGRQLGRRAEAPQGEMLAPRNGYTWLCRHWGANSVGDRPSLRVKCWRPATEIQGFAGNGAPTWPVPGPPFPVFSARGWCTNPRRPLFFRSLCTKSSGLFGARPARTWCTNPRKASFLRSICTKSPGLFSARPAMGRQLGRLPTTGRRLESRKGEWPRPFSFSSFPQSKASGGTPEAHELLFLCSISIQSISIS